jgi:aspartate kinase
MKVYKFGGASVRSAEAIRNLAEIVRKEKGPLVIVISAFGKTTNALEHLVELYFLGDEKRFEVFEEISRYHLSIAEELFQGKEDPVFLELETIFSELHVKVFSAPQKAFDFEYDQIVSLGEILSTRIVSAWLNKAGVKNDWLDLRTVLITDYHFREANVDWDEFAGRLPAVIDFKKQRIFLTQGFIGGTLDGYATTLGREGSDYTAALVANVMGAEHVTVWKDVPGIMTADPDLFEDVDKLEEISYEEAIELSYFGAKIIHPKTIKPLQNKNIPLYVKSFLDPSESGTLVHSGAREETLKPVIILKENQTLISLVPRDFSFVIEESLSLIFQFFFKYNLKVNLIQNSAISFSICVDGVDEKISALMEELQEDFKTLYNEDVSILTVRHYTPELLDDIREKYPVLLEQRSRKGARFVIK